MAKPPKLLAIQNLPKIHLEHPEIGKALQELIRYINQNVTPRQGNKV